MDFFTIALILLGAVALAVLGWVVMTYNRFVTLRTHIRESWSGVDVELRRRYNLIPRLVETAKGYMAHERETLERVVELRNKAADNAGAVDSQARDESALNGALRQLFAVVESYPDLKADAHFTTLQEELGDTEDRIAAARRFYNGNVRAFNALREMFPSVLIAGAAGFGEEPYFEIEDPAERAAPEVSF